MPAECVESLKDIAVEMAKSNARLDAIHEQTAKTNGHVAKLFARTEKNAIGIAVLKVKAGFWGGLAGLIAGAVALAAWALKN